MENDLHALRQHLILSAYTPLPPHSSAHFSPTSHASHRPFPASSEDRETLGSHDTIDPSDLLPPTGRTILQPSESDDSSTSDDSDATEIDDIEDGENSNGAQSVIGCTTLYFFCFYQYLTLGSYISLYFLFLLLVLLLCF